MQRNDARNASGAILAPGRLAPVGELTAGQSCARPGQCSGRTLLRKKLGIGKRRKRPLKKSNDGETKPGKQDRRPRRNCMTIRVQPNDGTQSVGRVGTAELSVKCKISRGRCHRPRGRRLLRRCVVGFLLSDSKHLVGARAAEIRAAHPAPAPAS